MTKKVFILFPNQLFEDIALLKQYDSVFLVEETLFFRQYKFHKQKLVLHRASMKYYAGFLDENNIKIHYIEAQQAESDIRELIASFRNSQTVSVDYYDVCDDWLHRRIEDSCRKSGLPTRKHNTPLFLNTESDLESYFSGKKKFFQTDFYIQQRKKLKILVDENNKPTGGKWSFDADNRNKYPKDKKVPPVEFPLPNAFYEEAIGYVSLNFPGNYGMISKSFVYPVTHAESEAWLQQFFEERFAGFGEYEDAIVDNEVVLHHSVLSPLLNIGLLTPKQVVDAAIQFAAANQIPVNSLEGFIRQIIGWREFIRGVYVEKGRQERTTNFWKFDKEIPASFYNGTTGIQPLDSTIRKILETGYCHHIERLMIAGNLMLLNEIHPDKVYQWFMELFIDAYDWVMVPNVYGMSQFADGGLMSTKPYISGSSYILKMSNYKKEGWSEIWDAMFWHFMNKHRQFFLSNPRLGMLIKTYDKMSAARKAEIEKHYSEINKKWYS